MVVGATRVTRSEASVRTWRTSSCVRRQVIPQHSVHIHREPSFSGGAVICFSETDASRMNRPTKRGVAPLPACRPLTFITLLALFSLFLLLDRHVALPLLHSTDRPPHCLPRSPSSIIHSKLLLPQRLWLQPLAQPVAKRRGGPV